MAECNDLLLYYSPPSFYSQIVLLAFYEKEVKFDRVIVDISNFEQNQAWYIRINPKGLVPTLKHGDKIVTDSRCILDYVDTEINSGIKLIPSPECQIGKTVAQWQKDFIDIKIDKLSYGIIRHPEMSVTGVKIPKFATKLGFKVTTDDIAKKANASLQQMKKDAERNTYIRETMHAKVKARGHPSLQTITKEIVQDIMTDVDVLLDKAEKQLECTRIEQGVPDAWLVSARFTAADIYLAVLLDRLTFLGLENHFFPKHKRPLLFDYYNRLATRSTVQRLRSQHVDLFKHIVWSKLRAASPFIFISVLAVAAYKTKHIWENVFP